MLITRIKAAFSANNDPLRRLLVKTPKTVTNDIGEGLLAKIFEQSKKSPTYLLLKELFAYLLQSPLLGQQFPFIKSDTRFEENWMAMHLQLLKARLREERGRSEAVNELELEKFNYNAQIYFFPAYAAHLNPQTPKNYTSHFAEAYLKRLLLFDQHFLESYQQRPADQLLKEVLRRLVYEHRVAADDAELAKLSRYYLAHRRYLGMLQWSDLVSYKVRWGFQGDRRLLQ